jgi:hypothetical protein
LGSIIYILISSDWGVFKITILKNKTFIIGFLLWLVAMSTPLVFHYARKYTYIRNHRQYLENTSKYKSFFNTISEVQKNRIVYSNLGLLRIGEDDFCVVGDDRENEELIRSDRIITRKIDYEIIDIKRLVLRSALMDVRTKLNDAEKNMLNDYYAVILATDNHEFFLVLNSEVYPKYVKKIWH